MPTSNKFCAIDLFAGIGGLSHGLKNAGFEVKAAVEVDRIAAKTYKENHRNTQLLTQDIRHTSANQIHEILNGSPLALLAGCPPCQGFSNVRSLNGKNASHDARNEIITEYVRFVRELNPKTFLMENVPGIIKNKLFQNAVTELESIGYSVAFSIVNIEEFGVPQRRKRLVMIGSRLSTIKMPSGKFRRKTVRDTIGKLPLPNNSEDWLHRISTKHSLKVREIIRRVPKNGGSRHNLPEEFALACHKNKNVGFSDIYGRMKWDDVAPTITGGCLNPSKGRFLHPDQNRAISPREASLLQTFPKKYKFPKNINKDALGLLIGNALPPLFAQHQGRHIIRHLNQNS